MDASQTIDPPVGLAEADLRLRLQWLGGKEERSSESLITAQLREEKNFQMKAL